MAYLALFIAVGGGSAYAINQYTGADIKDGTLTGADVKDRSLHGVDIARNTIGGGRIANNSLSTADINDSTLTNAQVRQFQVSTGKSGSGQLVSFGGLTLSWAADVPDVPTECHLRGSSSAPGQLNASAVFSGPTGATPQPASVQTKGNGVGTPITDFELTTAWSDSYESKDLERSVGQVVFFNSGTKRVVTATFFVYAHPTGAGCEFQGTLTAAG